MVMMIRKAVMNNFDAMYDGVIIRKATYTAKFFCFHLDEHKE